MTPPVNTLHQRLRELPLQAAIDHVRNEIILHGHETVKADPGVYAWVMENRSVLTRLARTGGLRGAGER